MTFENKQFRKILGRIASTASWAKFAPESEDPRLAITTPKVKKLIEDASAAGPGITVKHLIQEGNASPDYSASIERAPRYTGFRVLEVSSDLLLDRSANGRDVLEIDLCGHEVHWRSDLLTAFELAAPVVGQTIMRGKYSDWKLEHFCLPGVDHENQQVFGWFALDRNAPSLNLDEVIEVQRFIRPRRACSISHSARARFSAGIWD